MNGTIRKSLHIKILLLVVGLISFGVAVSVYWEVKTREGAYRREERAASLWQSLFSTPYTTTCLRSGLTWPGAS